MPMNLLAIVRPLINQLHPDVESILYRSTGQKNIKGIVHATYAPGESVQIQFQSEGPTVLNHAEKVGMEEVVRKLYLFSSASMSDRVAGIVRPELRNGDFIRVSDSDPWYSGTWWLVLGPEEDFTRAGWSCVRAVMEVTPPDFQFSDWWTG